MATAIVTRHFDSATPENLLKWEAVHPEPGRYNFEPADRYVAFAEKRGMTVIGHVLVWHSQTPAWVFEGKDGAALDRETALSRMREHIRTVVGRYKGRIKGWDVVNEAIDDGPEGAMRKSRWREAIGDDYIAKAFEYAHEADPAGRALLQRLQPDGRPQTRRRFAHRQGAQAVGTPGRRSGGAGPLAPRRAIPRGHRGDDHGHRGRRLQGR